MPADQRSDDVPRCVAVHVDLPSLQAALPTSQVSQYWHHNLTYVAYVVGYVGTSACLTSFHTYIAYRTHYTAQSHVRRAEVTHDVARALHVVPYVQFVDIKRLINNGEEPNG